MANETRSVGVVKTRYQNIGDLRLESGKKLSDVTLAYETYGRLNRKKDNVILLCHALSGDQHAAGKHRKNSRRNGWYDIAVGPDKTFDTRKYFVISSNVVGGCQGSTGPSSVNPKTGKPYGLDFPTITIKDMVDAQKKLLDALGVKKLFAVVGGSMGGMQALQWTVSYPDSVENVIALACSAKQYPLAIAFHEIGRRAILTDPSFKSGKYLEKGSSKQGLSLARQIAHITYLSQESLQRKFGRKKRKNGVKKFGLEFDVQRYLNYKGKNFTRRFDAYSYLYITHAIDQFDLTDDGKKTLAEVFSNVKSKVFLTSFKSDWLYTPAQVREIYEGFAEAGVPVVYRQLDLPYGHDSFLIYNNTLGNVLLNYLKKAKQ